MIFCGASLPRSEQITEAARQLGRAIAKLADIKAENEDEKLGVEIIRRAVEEPLRQIVENAGLEGRVVVNEVKNGKGDYGYNARTEKYENLFQSGVIDPANEQNSSGVLPCGPRKCSLHRRYAPHHRVCPLRHQRGDTRSSRRWRNARRHGRHVLNRQQQAHNKKGARMAPFFCD